MPEEVPFPNLQSVFLSKIEESFRPLIFEGITVIDTTDKS